MNFRNKRQKDIDENDIEKDREYIRRCNYYDDKEMKKYKMKFCLIIIIIIVSVFLIIYLPPEERNIIVEIIRVLTIFAGGYGYGVYSNKSAYRT